MRSSLALALVCACGSQAQRTANEPSKLVRLAVLPAESATYPEVASAVNSQFAHVSEGGVETFHPTVTMEVVQLSIECIDPTPACYAAAGTSLSADRLLFALIGKGPTVEVTVTMFDVAAERTIAVAEKEFASPDEAIAGVAALVEKARHP